MVVKNKGEERIVSPSELPVLLIQSWAMGDGGLGAQVAPAVVRFTSGSCASGGDSRWARWWTPASCPPL